MPWKLKLTDQWAERLRFTVRAAFFANAMLLSLMSVYLTAKLCWFFSQFLNRTLFAQPW